MKPFLLLLLCAAPAFVQAQALTYSHGAIVRGDSTRKSLSLVFTADEFGEGLPTIIQTLKEEKIKAGFFFTGRFYRNNSVRMYIRQLKKDGHYLGPHSDQHLLYCDWNKRDSLLVTKDSFEKDVAANLKTMRELGIVHSTCLFIPPFEWWNDSAAAWSSAAGLKLFNFTPGIRTNTDYTWPELGAAYKNSDWIMNWITQFVATNPAGLNGAIILLHAGTDPRRKDKFYIRLKQMIRYLEMKGYVFRRIDELLN